MESSQRPAVRQWHENCILCFEYLTTPLHSVAAIQHAFIFCNVRLFSSDLQRALMFFLGQPIGASVKYDFNPILSLNIPAELQSIAHAIEAFRRLVETLNDVASFQCDHYEQHLNCLLTLADFIGNEELADDISSMFSYDKTETDPVKRLWSRTWFNIEHPDAVQHDPLHLNSIEKLKTCYGSTDPFPCHELPYESRHFIVGNVSPVDGGNHSELMNISEQSLGELNKSQEQEEEEMKKLLQWIWDGD